MTWEVSSIQEYDDDGRGVTRSPGKRPSVTLRFGSSMLLSPSTGAAPADSGSTDPASTLVRPPDLEAKSPDLGATPPEPIVPPPAALHAAWIHNSVAPVTKLSIPLCAENMPECTTLKTTYNRATLWMGEEKETQASVRNEAMGSLCLPARQSAWAEDSSCTTTAGVWERGEQAGGLGNKRRGGAPLQNAGSGQRWRGWGAQKDGASEALSKSLTRYASRDKQSQDNQRKQLFLCMLARRHAQLVELSSCRVARAESTTWRRDSQRIPRSRPRLTRM